MPTIFTNQTKNTSVFGNQERGSLLDFITTDTPDYVMVGASEDLYLIWNEGDTFTNQTKN